MAIDLFGAVEYERSDLCHFSVEGCKSLQVVHHISSTCHSTATVNSPVSKVSEASEETQSRPLGSFRVRNKNLIVKNIKILELFVTAA